MTTKIYSVSDTQTKIQIDGTDVVTIDKVGGIQKSSIQQMPVLGTAQATTSVTFIDFTGIPSWVKKVTLMFNSVSTSGSNGLRVQVGAGSVDTAGYAGNFGVIANANVTATGTMSGAGFDSFSMVAAGIYHGKLMLEHMGGNLWLSTLQLTSNETRIFMASGVKTLAGALDRVRLTTIGSTDTFDAGSVNISYE